MSFSTVASRWRSRPSVNARAIRPGNGIRLRWLFPRKRSKASCRCPTKKCLRSGQKSVSYLSEPCQSTDPVWQKRRRVIDTRLLVVFILKLVLSRNRQGYGSNLGALWEACSDKGITLLRTGKMPLRHLPCAKHDKNCRKPFSKRSTMN